MKHAKLMVNFQSYYDRILEFYGGSGEKLNDNENFITFNKR